MVIEVRNRASRASRRIGMKSGNVAKRSGQYEIIGSRGAPTGIERTVVKGEPLPPTPKAGQTYKLVDPTNNGSGRKRK